MRPAANPPIKMPPAKASSLALVCGDDEFAVKKRAKEIYLQWSEELGGMDHEIIDASVANGGDALAAIAKLREALQTLPFFGSGKVVWLRDCNFLGDDRTASSQAVTETLAELADEIKNFKWQNVRLLVSAGKVDKRKVFYKALDKIGTVESYDGWSDKDWAMQAAMLARKIIQSHEKEIAENALAELINRVGPHPRQLESEVEKLCLSVGDRKSIAVRDVAAICSRNKMSRAFALGDALGDRNLPALLRCLDEELWEIRLKVDREKSEIGLLYGLISKVRAMLMLKEMVREGWVKADADYNRFKSQLERVPKDAFPAEKKFNPLAMHPFVLHRALEQSKHYSRVELVRAMNLLLEGNRRLVSSGLDEALVLQQMLVQIVAPQGVAA
jgi:DNA polymerase-3 subunit delta